MYTHTPWLAGRQGCLSQLPGFAKSHRSTLIQMMCIDKRAQRYRISTDHWNATTRILLCTRRPLTHDWRCVIDRRSLPSFPMCKIRSNASFVIKFDPGHDAEYSTSRRWANAAFLLRLLCHACHSPCTAWITLATYSATKGIISHIPIEVVRKVPAYLA
jgi:hypothetical protein